MAHEVFDHDQKSQVLWWLAILCGVLTLVFGSIGVARYEHQAGLPGDHSSSQPSHGLSPAYHAVQMLILHTAHFERGVNIWIELGRWSGVVTFFAAASALFWKRLRRELLLFRLRWWSDHHVICGLGRKGFEIAMCLAVRRGQGPIVVIDPQPDPHFADTCLLHSICVLHADATEPKALAKARVPQAKEIIVITADDSTNVRIGKEVRLLRAARAGEATPCQINLADIHLCEALQNWTESDPDGRAGCRLHFFDVFDQEARRVLLGLPLDGGGIRKDDPHSVHVVLLGFGRMARSLALRAAKMGHFANGKQLRISVIDRNADVQRERFLFRYPVLKDGDICRVEFFPGEAETLATAERVSAWAREEHALLHVFVCLDTDTRAVEVALRLRMVLKQAGHTLNVRVHAQKSLAPILELASEQSESEGRPTVIKSFGMVEDVCSDDAFRHGPNERLAEMIHKRYALRIEGGTARKPKTDSALREWDRLHEVFRESNRQQADHIGIKLRAIGCDLAPVEDPRMAVERIERRQVEELALVEHRRWLAERRLGRWHYDTPPNKDMKRSEYLVSWDELPESVREYDCGAVADIPLVLKESGSGLKIVKKDKGAAMCASIASA